jgi:protein SCO1/2
MVLAAFALALPLVAAAQQGAALDAADAVAASRAAIGRTIGDEILLDRRARPVSLAHFRGKPLLVSFIYTGCFQVCPLATRSLDEAVGVLQTRFGSDAFNVVSIGFNQPADSPQAMKDFAQKHRIDRANWDFLSAPAAIVPALTSTFGFRYAPTPAGFDHVLQVTVVDAQGRIVRQVWGDQPASRELGDALAQLAANGTVEQPGAVAQLVERIRVLCTRYDPETGTYRVDYSLAWEIAGGITFILFMALYMLNEWWTRRRERRHGRRLAG